MRERKGAEKMLTMTLGGNFEKDDYRLYGIKLPDVKVGVYVTEVHKGKRHVINVHIDELGYNSFEAKIDNHLAARLQASKQIT